MELDQEKSKSQIMAELREARAKISQLQNQLSSCVQDNYQEFEKIKELLDNASLGCLSLDEQSKVLEVNQACLDILGYSRDEVRGKNFSLFLQPRDQKLYEENFTRFQQGGEILDLELNLVCKDGSIVLINLNGLISHYRKGDLKKIQCIIQNITGQKRFEEALRENEKRLISAQHIAKTGDFTWDIETGVVTWSEALHNMLQYDQTEKIDYNKVNKEIHHPEDLEQVTHWLDNCVKSGSDKLTPNEYRVIRKDGQVLFVRTVGVIERKEGKQPKVFATVQDISEHKKIEQALRIRNWAIESSINAIAFADLSGNLSYVNPSFLKMWGYKSNKEVLGKPAVQFWELEEKASWVMEVLREKGSWIGELMAKKRDGSTFDVQLSASMVTDETGEPICMMASFVDITDRKQAEEDLKKEKKQAEQYLNIAGTMLVIVDSKEKIFMINKKGYQDLGYKEKELIGQNWFDLLVPERIRKEVRQVFNQLMNGEVNPVEFYENPLLTKEGQEKIFIFHNKVLREENDRITGVLFSAEDITERKRSEEALRESEEKYRSIFENTGTATIIVEEDTTISLANRKFEILTGYTKQEIEKQKSWIDFVAFDYELSKMKEYHYQRRIDPNSVPKGYEFHLKNKQGEIRYILLTIDVIPGTSKSVASHLDITELKQTQEALHEREEKYRLLAENNAEIIWSVDADLKFTYLSPSVERILGYSQQEAYNVSLDKRVTPTTYAMLMEKYQEIKSGRIKDTLTLELEQVRKDGSIIWTEVSITPLFDQKGRLSRIQGVTREITQRKEMERRLQVLKYAVESSINGFALIDLHGGLTYINPSFLEIGKFDHESEVLDKHFSEFLEKEEQSSLILNSLHNQGQWNGELTVKRKDNTVIYIHLLASKVRDKEGKPVCFIGSFVDITARKQAEEKLQQAYEHLEYRVEYRTKELKKSESRLKRSQQVAKVATWERDFQTGEIFWSDEQYRLFGYEPGELAVKEIIEKHISSNDQNRINKRLDMAIKEKGEFKIRFCYLTKNGEKRIAHCLGQVEWNELGKPLYIYGTMQDITEKIEMEQALQESQECYEQLLLSTHQVSSYKNIIGKSKPMQQIYTLIQQLANVDTTVLITGESGTGKELIVEALHYSGTRAKGPLIKVNCSALSEHLLESELFGHVRGAFTGAIQSKKGRIEVAEGGTLFLDEIGDISPSLQLKLLRFLQEKNFERVGDVNTLSADVRIIAATNADLAKKVQDRSFRSDLYYRLKVIPINIPPLRERPEDIPLLVSHFCQRFSQTFNKKISGVSNEVMRFFIKHPWPGNVRELEHVLECACLFCPVGLIDLEHLPEKAIKRDAYLMDSPLKKKKIGKEELLEALNRTRGNKTKAAKLLGISRRTLYRKLSESHIA